MLQLVHVQLNASSPFWTRVPMTRTTCAVDAAAGAGSTERSNDGRAFPVSSMVELVHAQLNVSSPFMTRVRIADVH